MPGLAEILEERLRAAFDTVEPGADPGLRPSERADFQVNGTFALAKRLGRSPREVAAEVVAAADLDGVCEQVEISGPGFVNLVLARGFIEDQVEEVCRDGRLGVGWHERPERVVVTYSAPNVAKEMHVGHLRSTVIGDALCRMLDHLGDEVIRENHVGDWGTPFGMLIEHLVDVGEDTAVHELSVGDLTAFYQGARTSFDASEEFRERSRHRVVLLQSGDPETRRMWKLLVKNSVAYFDEVYEILGVLLRDEDIRGESAYDPLLGGVVEDLRTAGLLVEDQGALCVFPPGFENRSGDPLPLIIQKSDGGFGYAATDLACIRDRVVRLGASRILYVIGTPQSQHLEMCFAVARMAGWLPDAVSVEHVAFGSVLGSDHRMLRTRGGGSVKLVDLLKEAMAKAKTVLEEKGRDAVHEAHERVVLARALGIGAVKYADLSTDRSRDYVFDWDRMLSFDGNTGPYLQYAHARICSILRRSDGEALGAGHEAPHGEGGGAAQYEGGEGHVILGQVEERSLALALCGYAPALRSAAEASTPSTLCTYLYTLATTFTVFYENCPVLRAPDARARASRLRLCEATARVLGQGLGLLGIEAPEQM